jgi:AraC family transcriptional regulator
MSSSTPSILQKAPSLLGAYLFESDFYHIKDWTFDTIAEKQPRKGYNDCFCVVYVKKGYYLFDQLKQNDMHSGQIIIEKANYGYSLRPATGACTILNFSDEFYERFMEDMNLKKAWFFSNPNIISQVLLATPETEYLHHQLLKHARSSGKLEIDNLVLEFLNQVISVFSGEGAPPDLTAAYLKFHLVTIEQAKQYLCENLASDISLYELARHCLVSPFHFNRLFKKATGYTPHQYLSNIRLKHGEMLLKNGTAPVSDISLQCGFSSVEYFATAFRQRYGVSPTWFRRKA